MRYCGAVLSIAPVSSAVERAPSEVFWFILIEKVFDLHFLFPRVGD